MSSPLPPPPPSPSSKTLSRTHSVLSNSNSNSSSSNTKESDILLLQGQILETILTIRNDGAAPANEIFIKFSHPNIILSKIPSENHENFQTQTHENGFELVPLYGRSGTVLKLLNKGKTPLLPGNELKYNLFLRLSETGKHRVSVIASCVCSKDDLESMGPQYPEAPTTPGYGGQGQGQGQGGPGLSPKHRTSIISFQVRIKEY